MSALVFWGDFKQLFTVVPTLTSESQVISSIAEVPGDAEYLFITRQTAESHTPALMDLKARRPDISLVLAYVQPATQENIHCLKQLPQIDHLIPIQSDTTTALMTRLLDPQRRQNIRVHKEALFLPEQLDETFEFKLQHSKECESYYQKIADYVEGLGCFTGFSELMMTAASELLTNAFYNGKRDPKTGKALVPDRQIKFALDPHEFVTLRYGRQGAYFWLVVTDCFGSLDRLTLINAMDRAATDRTPRLNTPGGAGLGLIMLFEWSTEMGFSLVRGTSTTVACKFKIARRQKEFDTETSSVHLIG